MSAARALAAACLALLGPATAMAAAGASAQQELPPRGSVGPHIEVWERAVALPGGRRVEHEAPLALALELAAPGCLISVLPGDHGPFSLGLSGHGPARARPVGGNPAQPVVVRAQGRVRLMPRGAQDTLAIGQSPPFGHVRFEGFEIHAGTRSAVMFYRAPPGQTHRGLEFIDCVIDGGFDHARDRGTHSKWGMMVWDAEDFVFAGQRRRAVVRNICHEHAFYVQHPRGELRFERIDAERLGRTFLQVTARASTGPPGRGRILVRDCRIEDAGIAGRDNYKGGSALTFAGRLEGVEIVVERSRVRAGFAPELRHRTLEGVPYGTAALVAWSAGEGQRNGHLILRDNHFEFAPGTGDRPLVSIAACRRVTLERNRFLAGAHPVALEFDPAGEDGNARDLPNGPIHLDRATELRGALQRLGRTLNDDQRAALATPRGAR